MINTTVLITEVDDIEELGLILPLSYLQKATTTNQ